MTAFVNQPYQIVQVMQIMNQLHRLAVSLPDNPFPPGMTVSQLACIGFVYYQEDTEVYQRDVESYFKLRRSTVSSLLNTLEGKDLIQRVSVPHDARLKKLVLTPQGREIGDRVQDFFIYLNRHLVQDLDENEQKTLYDLLVKINDGLNRRCL